LQDVVQVLLWSRSCCQVETGKWEWGVERPWSCFGPGLVLRHCRTWGKWKAGAFFCEQSCVTPQASGRGAGKGTTVRSCVKAGKIAANKQVDDVSGNGTMVRPCNKQESCITCNVARRNRFSDNCNRCQLAFMAALFSTWCKRRLGLCSGYLLPP
jgi:hypothetical protein